MSTLREDAPNLIAHHVVKQAVHSMTCGGAWISWAPAFPRLGLTSAQRPLRPGGQFAREGGRLLRHNSNVRPTSWRRPRALRYVKPPSMLPDLRRLSRDPTKGLRCVHSEI